MKHLIRRLSRVSYSNSQYTPLRSDKVSPRRARRGVPVYVGDEMKRFMVSAELLNHPVFVGLLNRSAQEYGYNQKGVLHIPCQIAMFERVMELLQFGELVDSADVLELLDDEAI